MRIPVKRNGDICSYCMSSFLKARFSQISWLDCVVVEQIKEASTEETGYIGSWQVNDS